MILFGVLLIVCIKLCRICFCAFMIDSGNKYTTCFSSVVMMNFKIVYVREVLKIFR